MQVIRWWICFYGLLGLDQKGYLLNKMTKGDMLNDANPTDYIIHGLHFYSLKSISKLNLDYRNFQNDFQITKDFENSKWKQEIFKMVSGGGYTFMVS